VKKRRTRRKRTAPEADSAEVVLYSDGACSGNPGPGGWAFILIHTPSGKRLEQSGAEKWTTNNKMELRAVIEGLRRLKRKAKVHVITDSSYVQQGITKWIRKWKADQWRRRTTSGFEPVKNPDLWKALDELVERHEVTFELIPGHAGHAENERCDQMAVTACQELMRS
jgi:ribonuclease HI